MLPSSVEETDVYRTGNVTDFLLAGKSPDRVFLELLRSRHTYGELQLASSQIAAGLSRLASKGDRVLLIGENSFFWVSAYLGIMRAGMICVPLPSGICSPDLKVVLRTTRPRFAFVQTSDGTRRHLNLDGIVCFAERQEWDRAAAPCPETLPGIEPNDIAALMFTSGSTGKPRGVMVTHRNIMANTASIVKFLKLTGEDRMMTVLPFHYCFGASLLHTHLYVGGCLVVDCRFMYPESILKRMAEARCTGFAGVPSHFQILLRRSSLGRKTFPHLRHVQQAGGRLAPPFVRELQAALPEARVFVMYGQTEATARLSYLDPDSLGQKPGSIGKGIPGVKLQVLDKHERPVAPGDVGEIVAEGDNIALGYWGDPEGSSSVRRNGRLYTGDLATVDDEGYIYIVDRVQDILKCGGKRVSCRQIEDQLLELEDLVEAAVVGIADDDLGEAVKAFVVPRSGGGHDLEDRIRRLCKRRLPPECVPRQIVVLDTLPRNSSGKILKANLRMADSPGTIPALNAAGLARVS
jgi:acyl-CoA synthetase (AMP-forming)/AMP-acid ligase II